MEIKHQCYLCMAHRWRKDGGHPTFAGYKTFSTAPWNVSNTGELYSAIYVTEGSSPGEAHTKMLDTVRTLAEVMPYWKSVWPWLDPSFEAQEKRFQLFDEVRKENV